MKIASIAPKYRCFPVICVYLLYYVVFVCKYKLCIFLKVWGVLLFYGLLYRFDFFSWKLTFCHHFRLHSYFLSIYYFNTQFWKLCSSDGFRVWNLLIAFSLLFSLYFNYNNFSFSFITTTVSSSASFSKCVFLDYSFLLFWNVVI